MLLSQISVPVADERLIEFLLIAGGMVAVFIDCPVAVREMGIMARRNKNLMLIFPRSKYKKNLYKKIDLMFFRNRFGIMLFYINLFHDQGSLSRFH